MITKLFFTLRTFVFIRFVYDGIKLNKKKKVNCEPNRDCSKNSDSLAHSGLTGAAVAAAGGTTATAATAQV